MAGATRALMPSDSALSLMTERDSLDAAVQKGIWSSKVPLCLQLCRDDALTLSLSDEQAEPLYVSFARCSYLYFVRKYVEQQLSEVLQAARANVPDVNIDIWFSVDPPADSLLHPSPLKLQCPLGLLADFYGALQAPVQRVWTLTVHLINFPDSLAPINTDELMESTFMALVKEADFLKHKATTIQRMQKSDHKTLWCGLRDQNYDSFWQINRRLQRPAAPPAALVPYRLYVQAAAAAEAAVLLADIDLGEDQDAGGVAGGVAGGNAGDSTPAVDTPSSDPLASPPPEPFASPTLSRPAIPPLPRDAAALAQQLLRRPHLQHPFKPQHADGSARVLLDLVAAALCFTVAPLRPSPPESLLNALPRRLRVVSHSIELPWDATADWLTAHFSYPDNFLHLVLAAKVNDLSAASFE